MQIFKAYFFFLQFLGDEAGHAFPLTEYHNLFTFLADNVADDVHAFFHFGVVSRLLIEDITAVTYHAHLREEEQKTLAVFIGQKMHLAPFQDQDTYLVLPLLMHLHLLVGHRNEKVLVRTLRHLEFHILLSTTDENIAQFLAYVV